jgi:hypothetical protein
LGVGVKVGVGAVVGSCVNGGRLGAEEAGGEPIAMPPAVARGVGWTVIEAPLNATTRTSSTTTASSATDSAANRSR